MKNKKGFTLVELIVVIAVMVIIAAIVVPKMSSVMGAVKSRSDERASEMYYKALRMKAHLGKLSETGDTVTIITEALVDEDVNNDGVDDASIISEESDTKEFYYKYKDSNLEIYVLSDATDTITADNTYVSATVIKLEFE